MSELSRLATEVATYATAASKAFARHDYPIARDYLEIARYAMRGIDEAVYVAPEAMGDHVRRHLAAIDLRVGAVTPSPEPDREEP